MNKYYALTLVLAYPAGAAAIQLAAALTGLV
jgi:hypothetical protein